MVAILITCYPIISVIYFIIRTCCLQVKDKLPREERLFKQLLCDCRSNLATGYFVRNSFSAFFEHFWVYYRCIAART